MTLAVAVEKVASGRMTKKMKKGDSTCGSPEHMAPSCTRPKGPGDTSPTRLKAQRAEGEESSPSSSKDKEEE